MTGSCWRLLAFLSLILSLPALHAQIVEGDRSEAIAPTSRTTLRTPPSRATVSDLVLPTRVDRFGSATLAPGRNGLPQIVSSAGIIFSGRVTAVRAAHGSTVASPGQNTAWTAITFQVEYALRGTTAGRSLTIHEWSGLSSGSHREDYRVGERVFLFLYPPSRLGFTSPVGEGAGRFAIDPQGNVAMNSQYVSALADPVISGRKVVPYTDFIGAVRRAGGTE
jgi:hypothetical protein